MRLEFGIGERNERGQKLADFALRHELFLAKTQFRHHLRSLRGPPRMEISRIIMITGIFLSSNDGEAVSKIQKRTLPGAD